MILPRPTPYFRWSVGWLVGLVVCQAAIIVCENFMHVPKAGRKKKTFWKSRRTQAKDPLPLLKIAIRLNFKHKTPNCTIKKFVAHH